jgi:8-oxo-dGTP pyrophosphatase MutT (NUDIX family)
MNIEYKEETGYDVGVYCEYAENVQSIWYFHEHYVHWLEQKIEALSQHDVMRSAFKEAYDKWHETENDGELGNWLFAKSKGITT